MTLKPRFSLSVEVEPASPEIAYSHFMNKLTFETDVADLSIDLKKGYKEIIVIDIRDLKSYEECHIPGAISLPNNKINEENTNSLSKDKVIITYCWGPACNGATRAAAKFAKLGFRVKELIGGIEYWRKEGGHVVGSMAENAPLYWKMR